MSPFRSIKGRALGKLIEGFKSSDIGKGFGSGGGGGDVAATGGNNISISPSGYKYHSFTSPGTFVCGSVSKVDILVVAGGGAGGSYYGGGGGAGGLIVWDNAPLNDVTSLTIVVGDGGANSPGNNVNGATGGDSTVSGWNSTLFNPTVLIAKGGGGGTPAGQSPGGVGGSGGGRGSVPAPGPAGGAATQPTVNTQFTPLPAFSQFGNAGGSYPPSSTGYAGAGGGGAGAAGGNGFQSPGGGAGGDGQPVPQFPGADIGPLVPVVPRMGPNGTYYAGGGSAGPYNGAVPNAAGHGGGGRGYSPDPSALQKGADGLGGGGGGRHPTGASTATNGGKGIVIIRYDID